LGDQLPKPPSSCTNVELIVAVVVVVVILQHYGNGLATLEWMRVGGLGNCWSTFVLQFLQLKWTGVLWTLEGILCDCGICDCGLFVGLARLRAFVCLYH